MLTGRSLHMDLNRPRKISEILADAAAVYLSQPLLFGFLAGVVLVPYEVLLLLIENSKSGTAVGTGFVLVLVELAVVNPCIAALEVHALIKLADGEQPRLGEVFRAGLRVLPVVAAAQIIAAILIGLGLVFFIVPGLIIGIRLAVVAPSAAVERTNWPGALRRSFELTSRNAWRTLGLLIVTGVINQIPALIIGTGAHITAAVLGVVLAVIVQAYVTLTLNMLYFDLRARRTTVVR
ncbi:MAG: hypothetical protein ACP5H2_05415 [Solirubrobacteraceae bacterium]